MHVVRGKWRGVVTIRVPTVYLKHFTTLYHITYTKVMEVIAYTPNRKFFYINQEGRTRNTLPGHLIVPDQEFAPVAEYEREPLFIDQKIKTAVIRLEHYVIALRIESWTTPFYIPDIRMTDLWDKAQWDQFYGYCFRYRWPELSRL